MDICNELSITCCEKFFGIKIDSKLTLEEHVEGLCKKASQKVSAVARISSLMRFEQRKRIVNLFITSNFSHYPLVWMFHSWRINNRIDHIHEGALKSIYQDYNSSFKELLRKDKTKINKNVLIKCQKQVNLHFEISYWQKQPLEMFCKKRCSWKFRKIRRKTPLPEPLF